MKPKLSPSAPLQMCFSLVSFLAKVKIFSFWPKTMDYSQAFWPKLSSLFGVFLLLTGGCYEAETFTIYSPSDVLSPGIIFGQSQNFQFLAENHGLHIVRCFDKN